jgi:hypothetical protein
VAATVLCSQQKLNLLQVATSRVAQLQARSLAADRRLGTKPHFNEGKPKALRYVLPALSMGPILIETFTCWISLSLLES